MKINYSSSKSDSIFHYTLHLLGIDEDDTSTLPLATFIRSANTWYQKVDDWIWQATGTWEFDDSNYSTLPIVTTTLVDGQQDYEIPSTARKIDKVTVLDSEGDEVLLRPIDKSQLSVAPEEHKETAGLPKEYDMVGRSVLLYPKPDADDVTLASGLKLYVTRNIDEFTTSDTTKEPGFDNHYHCLIAYGVALDFALSYVPEKVNTFSELIKNTRSDLQEFYGFRHRDMKPRFRPKKESLI